jgi:iron complex outermembrane recepter protein
MIATTFLFKALHPVISAEISTRRNAGHYREGMMQLRFRTHFALAATAMGVVLSSPALAQEEAAQETASSSSAGDIIVTARRVEERLQDVPISMTVFSEQQITDKNIAVASDLATYTPSLSVNTRFGAEKAAFAIRGFNQDASTAPTVGVYFADVVGPRAQGGTTSGNSAAAGSFVDLQNVQVLKGPQGTLFGRNTTGGAVLLVPRKPNDNLEGFVEGTIGNYDQRRVQAALNVPLAETFKVRFAVDRNKRDGYMKNHSGVGPDAFNDVDYFYGRVGVVADLTPDLENYTVAYYSKSDTEGYAARIVTCDSAYRAAQAGNPLSAFSATDPITRQPLVPRRAGINTFLATTGAACDQLARQEARGDGLTDVEVYQPDQSTGVHLRQWQIINTTTWRASDNLTIKNIFSYGEFRENSGFNLNSDNFFLPREFGPLAGQRFQYINLDSQPGFDAASQSTTTEELQIQGNTPDGKLVYVVGGYLEFSRPMGWNQQRTGIFGNCLDAGTLNCAAPLGFVSISQSRTRYKFDNHGIFAQATYNFTDQLALTLGGRYTFDKVVGLSESTRFTLVPTAAGGVVPASQSCNDTFRHPTVNALTDPLGTVACRTEITEKSNRPTWMADFSYKPIDDVMLYGKYARGYRQGGVNFTNPGLETWDPEKVDLYEIGAKASFSGAVNGYFNIAAFYNDFSDQQVFAQAVSGTPLVSGGNVIVNAGKSVLKGFEIDSSATFFDSLRFDVGYTFLDTKLKDIATEAELAPRIVGTPFVRLIPQSAVGDPLTYSPKHKLSATATYTLPLDESVGEVSIGGTWLYTSHQFAANALASPIGRLPSTDLFNLNLNWNNVAGSPIDLAAFATNITNEKYPVAIGQGFNSGGFDSYLVGQPRMYGVRLRYRFGD